MRWLFTILTLLFLTACSAPRYVYYFPQPPDVVDRPGGRVTITPLTPPSESSELHAAAVVTPEVRPPKASAKTTPPAIHIVPADERPPAMARDYPTASPIKEDPELRRSVIFTAGGLVALLIGGSVFWVVGSLCLLIGLIFAIKWLLRK